MNLEELRAVQADERRSDSLQELPNSFYQEATDYLEELRDERKRAADRAADPFSSEEVRRLTDEIETAQEVLEAIYERRIGKVVARASLAAADMTADEESLTDEEAALFADLVDRIEANREAVLDAIAGEGTLEDANATAGASSASGGADPSGPNADDPADNGADPVLDAEAAMSGGDTGDTEDFARGAPDPEGDRADAPESIEPDGGATTDVESGGAREPDGTDRMTVRITEDVGEVFGVDERVYDLAAEDVVTLPTPNAEPLIERNAAQPLE